jgi:predicted DNA-binding protein
MLVEKRQQTAKMLSTRTDDEMFYALKALSQVTGVETSTLMRLAIAALLQKARTLEEPFTWDDLKRSVEVSQE